LGKQSAIIGGGVIGAGWAARFLLMGWDVKIFDMDPEAHRKINEVLENARRSLPGLYNVKLPDEGSINFCDTIENAVRGAEWIQESVPERLPLKHKVYHEILKFADKNAIIASSTSGYKPSELNGGIQSQSRVVVAHPFNPVYLLPLIELVPAVDASKPMISRAQKILSEIGMYPLLLRKEIDAHIADRFLEAVWRSTLAYQGRHSYYRRDR
jgi:carnitine 3-dehydrogenase